MNTGKTLFAQIMDFLKAWFDSIPANAGIQPIEKAPAVSPVTPCHDTGPSQSKASQSSCRRMPASSQIKPAQQLLFRSQI